MTGAAASVPATSVPYCVYCEDRHANTATCPFRVLHDTTYPGTGGTLQLPDPDPIVLGAAVEFTWTLHRVRGTGDRAQWKVWRPGAHAGAPEPAARTGVLVGTRTLSNGTITNYGYDGGIEYQAREHFTAYLIAHDLTRKPVLCLPEHVTFTPTGDTP